MIIFVEILNYGTASTEIFCKSCRDSEFFEAARLLCVTQSTLSQQVKQLEVEMGSHY